MIQTSYFVKYKESNAVSIARKTPDWFTGETYINLAPPWSLIMAHKKKEICEVGYIEGYYRLVLNKLDPIKVLRELDGKVLLCWEGKGVFCHRHLVAQWLNTVSDEKVTEI